MKKIFLFAVAFSLLLCLPNAAYAEKESLEFYRRPFTDDLKNKPDIIAEAEAEIREQARAVMEVNGIADTKALASFTAEKAVKAVSGRPEEARDVNYTGSPLDSLDAAVSAVKNQWSGRDMFSNRFVEYVWKVPVLETENAYLFANVKVNSPDDIVISSTYVPHKELSDATYLFDSELVSKILKNSGIKNIDYDVVLPVSLAELSTDIVIFSADRTQYGTKKLMFAIPFSARPDLLGIENGKIYEYEKIEAVISDIQGRLSSGGASGEVSGGGAGQKIEPYDPDAAPLFVPWVLCITLAYFAAGTAAAVIYQRRKKRNK